ncbi:DUF4191 domain-containing protein [Lapillicoccus sp.]|uniref:DUF4191 domain-containing protein n=1 Tax=Lapillicoccus sp. TaxID=1909287 RepID=UPI003983CC27
MAKDPAPKDATPKKPGRVAQVRQVFTAARAVDPQIGWWMALAFLGVLLVAVVIGVLTHFLVFAIIIGIAFAALAATIVLSRRAERAAYRQIEGQPGAVGATLSSLRRGWFFDQQPVAADAARANDMASAAMVYRAVGRPGIVLIGEGPPARAQKLLAAERKRVERVAPGVPVLLLRVGDGDAEGEVGIRKLTTRVQRLKPVLTKDEVSVVNKRLKALGGMRTPVPKGVDPTKARMDRRSMRGR